MSTDVNPSAESARRIAASFEELRLPLSARARRDPVAFALDLLLLAIIRFLEHMGRELAENARLRAAGLLPISARPAVAQPASPQPPHQSSPFSEVSRPYHADRYRRSWNGDTDQTGVPARVSAPALPQAADAVPRAYDPDAHDPAACEPRPGFAERQHDHAVAADGAATLPRFKPIMIAPIRTGVAARASPRPIFFKLAPLLSRQERHDSVALSHVHFVTIST